MKMESDKNFREAVLSVIDALKASQIRSGDSKVDYLLSASIEDRVHRLHGFEREALAHLQREGIIRETGDRDDIEIGELGTSTYQVYERLNFEIVQSLDAYAESFSSSSQIGKPMALTFDPRTGKFVYLSSNYEVTNTIFEPGTNPYQLIRVVLFKHGKLATFDECAANMKETKLRAKDPPTEEEKVRNTLKTIRSRLRSLNVPADEVEAMFKTEYGVRVTIPFTIIPEIA